MTESDCASHTITNVRKPWWGTAYAIEAKCVCLHEKPARAILRANAADLHDEVVGLAFQNLQGHGARIEHHIVEFLERESAAESCFRFLPQLKNFQLADHVGTCLTRPNHVAFDLRSFNAVVDRLLSGPTFCVKSGIDDQPPSPKLLPIELPQQTFEIVFVPTRFGGEVLSVETPALDAGGNPPSIVSRRNAGRSLFSIPQARSK